MTIKPHRVPANTRKTQKVPRPHGNPEIRPAPSSKWQILQRTPFPEFETLGLVELFGLLLVSGHGRVFCL